MTGREGETFPGFFHAWGELLDMGPCGCSLSGKRRRSRRAHCHVQGERGMRASQDALSALCRSVTDRLGVCGWRHCRTIHPAGMQPLGSGAACRLKNTNIFLCFSGMLIEQSVSRGQNRKFFCGKMLDGGVEKAHKAVRANELPRRGREKNFREMKKNLLTAKTKRRKQLLRAEWIGVVH